MSVRRPRAELDLGHQLGTNIAGKPGFLGGELFGEGTRWDSHPVEPLEQVLGHGAGESGADAAHMLQSAVIIDAQHQGADGFARGRGRHIAGDDEFPAGRTLRFDPCLATARPIRPVHKFGNDTLQAQPTGMAQDKAAIFIEMAAVADEARLDTQDSLQHDRLSRAA